MNRILLLDIDGVLVQPGGYRAALRASVQRFVGDFYIEESWLTEFEKRGISSEWDMVPLLIASYWDDVLARQPMPDLPDDVFAAAGEIERRRKVEKPRRLIIPEFELLAGQYPAQAALQAGCFPHIPARLRERLLARTRDIQRSATMRTFQHFTLGSETYTQTYALPAEFETESLLLARDKPNLDKAARTQIAQSGFPLAAFTARPSLPPREVSAPGIGYAPEAEMALKLLGLQHLPLAAFGKLEYLASQHQLDPQTLVKPSPFHALAGCLAAWTRQELPSLQAAYTWFAAAAIDGLFGTLPRSFELVVIEDTLSGVRSARAAGEILQKAGFEAVIRPLGLTNGVAAKASAFASAGVSHFDSWDELLAEIDL